MSVNIDLCCGHGLCVAVAPNIFEMDDGDERAHVTTEHPSESERENVMKAIRTCPQMAIDVYDQG